MCGVRWRTPRRVDNTRSYRSGSKGESRMSDEHRGIYEKYHVERLNDPEGKHAACNYFVLDLVHDKFAIPALRAYAKACERKFPQLAKDIRWSLRLASGPKGDYFPATLSSTMRLKMEHEGRG